MNALSSKEIAALKARAQELPAILQIGKSGLSEGMIEEVQAQLEREPLVKIKLLKSALEDADKRELAERLAEAVGATLVEVRGFTLVLYRRKGRRKKIARERAPGDPGA